MSKRAGKLRRKRGKRNEAKQNEVQHKEVQLEIFFSGNIGGFYVYIPFEYGISYIRQCS